MSPDGTHVVHVEAPRGSYKCKVDEKGRLKLPAALHKFFIRLDQEVVFATTLDRKTALVYPVSEWKQNEAIFEENQENPAAADLWFIANHYGADCAIDAQGRIPLPDLLRQALNLDGADTWMVRSKGHFDCYTAAAYGERLEKALAGEPANLAEMARKLR